VQTFGYIPSVNDYYKLLNQCDIVLSTAIHEFQGVSVMEAVAAGCLPLVPGRLSYKEYIESLYCYESNIDDPIKEAVSAVNTLLDIMGLQVNRRIMSGMLKQYSWSTLLERYRGAIDQVLKK